jgi:hypothetical protein
MDEKSKSPRTDFDGARKLTLDRYLDRFLQLCFPTVHAAIDWCRGAAQLDQELQEVVRDAETGKRRVVSLAALADTSPGFRPGAYEEKMLDCRVRFEYPSCKLLDFADGDVPDAIWKRLELIQEEARLRALLKAAIQTDSIEGIARIL